MPDNNFGRPTSIAPGSAAPEAKRRENEHPTGVKRVVLQIKPGS